MLTTLPLGGPATLGGVTHQALGFQDCFGARCSLLGLRCQLVYARWRSTRKLSSVPSWADWSNQPGAHMSMLCFCRRFYRQYHGSIRFKTLFIAPFGFFLCRPIPNNGPRLSDQHANRSPLCTFFLNRLVRTHSSEFRRCQLATESRRAQLIGCYENKQRSSSPVCVSNVTR